MIGGAAGAIGYWLASVGVGALPQVAIIQA